MKTIYKIYFKDPIAFGPSGVSFSETNRPIYSEMLAQYNLEGNFVVLDNDYPPKTSGDDFYLIPKDKESKPAIKIPKIKIAKMEMTFE